MIIKAVALACKPKGLPKIQPNKANKVRLSIKISFKENLPMLSNSFLAHKLTSFEPFKVGLQVLYANKGTSKIKTHPTRQER